MEVHLSGKKHAKKLKIIEKINDGKNSLKFSFSTRHNKVCPKSGLDINIKSQFWSYFVLFSRGLGF